MIRVALLLTLGTPEVGLVIQQADRMFTFQARSKVNNYYVKNGRHYLNPPSNSGSFAIFTAIPGASSRVSNKVSRWRL
jgi:hypothetical protein